MFSSSTTFMGGGALYVDHPCCDDAIPSPRFSSSNLCCWASPSFFSLLFCLRSKNTKMRAAINRQPKGTAAPTPAAMACLSLLDFIVAVTVTVCAAMVVVTVAWPEEAAAASAREVEPVFRSMMKLGSWSVNGVESPGLESLVHFELL